MWTRTRKARSSRDKNKKNKKKKKILLVDDEPDTCIIYQMALEDAGYECISYTDSVKPLQEFRPHLYDLILLDIKMPTLSGFDLCKIIIELDPTVHIIFITAGGEGYYEDFKSQHFPELDTINYIQKPTRIEELVRMVDTIIAIQ
jgi:DNA-binding response OmpR family regulator